MAAFAFLQQTKKLINLFDFLLPGAIALFNELASSNFI